MGNFYQRTVTRTFEGTNYVFSFILISFMFLIIGSLFFTTTPSAFFQQMSSRVVLISIAVTFGSSFIASLLVFVFSVPTAYVLSRKTFWGKRVLETIVVDLPLSFPPGVDGLILLLLLSKTGILGEFLGRFNIYIPYTFTAVVLAKLFVSIPFMISFVREAFDRVDKNIENVACALGASSFQIFYKLTFPLSVWGVLKGLVMALSKSLGEIGATLILAGGLTSSTGTMSVLIYFATQKGEMDKAIALAIILEFLTFIMLTIIKLLFQESGRKIHA
ncbi:MAG: ABC transporter permease [Planctomycetota bacterium]|nr:ABC transporter permease [Planctomycetota bacterium]MDE1888694.1 ABC transporter permease [Planctomycetota bacterium]MDE2217547.1 ABC transporter permease [Planctomycetota bacterium]